MGAATKHAQSDKKKVWKDVFKTQAFGDSPRQPTNICECSPRCNQPKSKSKAFLNLSKAGFFSTIMSYRSLSDKNAFFSSMA